MCEKQWRNLKISDHHSCCYVLKVRQCSLQQVVGAPLIPVPCNLKGINLWADQGMEMILQNPLNCLERTKLVSTIPVHTQSGDDDDDDHFDFFKA